MKTKKLNIGSVKFVATEFDWEIPTTLVTIEYTEYSPDHWYSDRETEVDISKEEAQAIINFLKESYNLT